jgi:hypothetical protein
MATIIVANIIIENNFHFIGNLKVVFLEGLQVFWRNGIWEPHEINI